MKIISWNVNGLRSIHRKGNWDWLIKNQPDVLCLQEIKAEKEQLPDEVQSPDNYFSYFSSSKGRKGYSGVAIYSKVEPKKIEYGIGIKKFDDEGRIIIAYYDNFVLLNIYFPNGGGGTERLQYKMDFYDAFLEFIEKLRKNGKKVIFCGDVNTAHEEIDIARPKENEKNTGFLPEERAWLDEVVAFGYVDVFRQFNPNKKDVYTWWDMKTRARDRNVGWRIDYFFVAQEAMGTVKDIKILSTVLGSDHCPVELELR